MTAWYLVGGGENRPATPSEVEEAERRLRLNTYAAWLRDEARRIDLCLPDAPGLRRRRTDILREIAEILTAESVAPPEGGA